MINEPASSKPDDEAIVLALMYGDEDGLRQLLRLYGNKVKIMLTRKFNEILTEEDIEEVFNDAVHKVFKSIDKYDEKKASLGVWFCRIAENTAYDLYRKEKKHRHESMNNDIQEENWQPTCLQEKSKSNPKKVRFHKELLEVINSLPNLQKNIITADLMCGEDASAASLAEKFGTTKNSIYVSRTKAHDNILKEMIKRGYNVDEGGENNE